MNINESKNYCILSNSINKLLLDNLDIISLKYLLFHS